MFKSPLRVEKIGPNAWQLLAPLVFDGSEKIIVPAGFETDFASVPRFFWRFCPPAAGNHAEPSVLHDYLCVTSNDQPHTDKIFLEAMSANGVGWLKRTVMYIAVRAYQTAKGNYFKKREK
ncbi:DUF1353 domain-containing protein [Desulfobacter sp.]|uniref:DUF1353 domain-containing protein n=1 Tax=Desulfobacter sp. TaxID=2294 RepID=UPI003D0DE499